MATSPNALAAQQLTGNDAIDRDRALLEEIRAITSQKPAEGEGNPAGTGPHPIKLKLPNAEGQLTEYTFENPDQLNAALVQTFNNFRQTMAEMQQQTAAAGATGDDKPKPAEGKPNLDINRFKEIATEDPAAGINYLLAQAAFGGSTPDAFSTLRQTVEDLRQIKEQLAVFQFREAHPEVGGSEHAQLLDGIRERLGISRDNPLAWEASLALAQQRGLLPTPQQIEYQRQQAAAQRVQQGPYIPAGLGRGTSAAAGVPGAGFDLSPEFIGRAEQLDEANLEALLKKFGG